MTTIHSRPLFDGPGARAILEDAYPHFDPTSSSTAPTTDPSSLPPLRRPSAMSTSTSTSSEALVTPATSRSTSASGLGPTRTKKGRRGKEDAPRSNNVSFACKPCRKAHLSCDMQRPCKRCVRRDKEDLCENVEHKPRGRPKQNHTPQGEEVKPGKRATRPAPTSPFKMLPSISTTTILPVVDEHASTQPAHVFEIFTTLNLRIVRSSTKSDSQTGFKSQHYLHHSLIEFVHPHDRQLLNVELRTLFTPLKARFDPNNPAHRITPLSAREVHSSAAQLDQRRVMSPASGMCEPYPHQNLRILKSDHTFGWFNVRLHLGGGLGGDMLRPETFGRLYLVVSFLALEGSQLPSDAKEREVASWVNTMLNLSSGVPPSTVTPVARGLPGFSALESVANGMQGRHATEQRTAGSTMQQAQGEAMSRLTSLVPPGRVGFGRPVGMRDALARRYRQSEARDSSNAPTVNLAGNPAQLPHDVDEAGLHYSARCRRCTPGVNATQVYGDLL